MAAGRYPLEALRTLRAEQEQARIRELAEATRTLEERARELARAEQALHAHERETARVLADERERDARGRTVAETLRARAWAARRARERDELRASLERARAAERDAERALDEARARLAEARAEREAIEKHHARWSQQRKKDAATREEQEVEDRRAGNGRGPEGRDA